MESPLAIEKKVIRSRGYLSKSDPSHGHNEFEKQDYRTVKRDEFEKQMEAGLRCSGAFCQDGCVIVKT